MIEAQKLYQEKVEALRLRFQEENNCNVETMSVFSMEDDDDRLWKFVYYDKQDYKLLAFSYVNGVYTAPIMIVNFFDNDKKDEEIWLV